MTKNEMPPTSNPWASFRRLMAFTVVAAVFTVVASIYWLHYTGVEISLLVAAMVAAGVFLTVMLAGALMGLVFVSSRSGIDYEVEDLERTDDER